VRSLIFLFFRNWRWFCILWVRKVLEKSSPYW
jgi:hypothetical protein